MFSVSPTALGLIAGLALGFAGAFGGFGALIVVLVLGALGLGVGRYLEGKLDLSSLAGLTGRAQDRDPVGRR